MDSGVLAMAREREMWDAVVARDAQAFRGLVSPRAVMICGGLKCTGAEYAGYVPEFNMKRYEIEGMAISYADENCVSLRYIVATHVDGPENDLSGRFYVTSLWAKAGERWELVFNMDSRIFDAQKGA